MKIITNRKLKQGALEDIAELLAKRPKVVDGLSNKVYWMITYTQTYIMKKFDLSKEEVEEYLVNSNNHTFK